MLILNIVWHKIIVSARTKLGAYIRGLDYLSVKEDNEYEDETPSNQLNDFGRQCGSDDDFNFEELKVTTYWNDIFFRDALFWDISTSIFNSI